MNTKWASDPLAVVVLMLAVHRLTRLLMLDTVPPLPAIRQAIINRHAADRIGELINCPWCLGFWVSAAVVLAASVLPRAVWQPIAVALAASSVTAVAFRLEG